ncbi:MAG: glycosyltransferase family 2 protein [Albidovulum sp.]
MAKTSDRTNTNGHVAILMATHNGAQFLADQLNSFLDQSYGDWSLWISDDGSTDGTDAILSDFRDMHPLRRIELLQGPETNSTANFLSILCNADISADYVALADQDDVWLACKLERAISAIEKSRAGPVLYGGRTTITAKDLTEIGTSPLFRRPPDFRNALVQSIAGGNTMVLNRAAHEVVKKAGRATSAVCHDWWLYQLISGVGGTVIYDSEPTVLYRQHARNQIGSNASIRARVARIRAMLLGQYRRWNEQNIAALYAVSDLLTPLNRKHLEAFNALSGRRGFDALIRLRKAGLFRQSRGGALSLAVTAFLGRL